jgi:Tfp pilus assembly protein PilF
MNEKLAKEAVPKPVPTMHTATIELAQKAYNSGQFKESVLFLETVPEELQHNADAFLLLAKSHEALGNNEIASSLYEQLSPFNRTKIQL